MARLLRSYGVSKLRPPAVVDAAVTFNPVKVWLAAQPTDGQQGRLRTTYDLRPPTKVGFTDTPVSVYTAEWRRPLATDSRLKPPAVVDPAITFPPVSIHTARLRPSPSRKATSKLRPPILDVTAPPSLPISVHLYKTRQPPPARYRLQPPAVTAVTLTLPYPVSVHLYKARKPPPVRFKLQPPAVTGASITFRPLQVKLVQPPRQARKNTSRLSPPILAAVIFVSYPLKVVLARIRPATVKSELRFPTVVDPAVTFRPLQTRLVRQPPRAAQPKSILRAPTVLGAVVVYVSYPVRVALARWRPPTPVKARLRPPAAVGAPIVFRAVGITLARITGAQQQGRASRSRLRAPVVVAGQVFAPIIVRLTRSKRKILSQAEVRPPSVVAPATTFRPILTRLVRRPPRAAQPKSRLRLPTVLEDLTAVQVVGEFVIKPAGRVGSAVVQAITSVARRKKDQGDPDEGDFTNRPGGRSS
jgi:hypothetical protein